MSNRQRSLFPEFPPSLPEGFFYYSAAISADRESCLLAKIVQLPFREFQFNGFQGKRRVISFGWRYDFSERKVLPADPIPEFLLDTCRNVQTTCGLSFSDLPQVLVTEYGRGAPIGWHREKPDFGNVMGLSLAAPCVPPKEASG